MKRSILEISGPDRVKFLQGLVTNDVTRLGDEGILYAALLTPQGKYLADFFLVDAPDSILVDVAASHAQDLTRRLALYRLRADVEIGEAPVGVERGTGAAPAGALADPRHPALGWRLYARGAGAGEGAGEETGDTQAASPDWDALRVAHMIPETGIELTPDTYILEAGFERLNGVDFRKGCYVGQEVTARMKHKSELKKGLVRVEIRGDAPLGTPITSEDGRAAGTLFTRSGDRALAHLRLDRARGPLRAGEARLRLEARPAAGA